MKANLIFISFLVLISIHLFSNESFQLSIDTLEPKLKTTQGEERIIILNSLILNYSIIDSTKAFEYFKEAVLLEEKAGLKEKGKYTHRNFITRLEDNQLYQTALYRMYKAIDFCRKEGLLIATGHVYSNLGQLMVRQNKYSKAKKYQDTAISIFEKHDFPYGLGLCNERMGYIFMVENEYHKALKHFYKALKINQSLGFEYEEAISLYHIGLTKLNLGNYSEAIDYILKSLEYWERSNNPANTWNCNELIGNIYIKTGQYDNALKYHRIALNIRMQKILDNIDKGMKNWHKADTLNNLGLAYSYNNIGETYLKMGKYDSAYYYALKSLKIKQSGKCYATENDVANSQLILGNIYGKLGKYDSAIMLINEAADKYLILKNKSSLAEAIMGLGNIYLEKGDLKTAEQNFLSALAISKSIDDAGNKKNALKSLSKVYAAMGGYKNALDYFRKYANVKDSLLNLNNLSRIEELQIEYQVDKKNQQILAQENLIKQKENNMLLVVIVGSLLAVILIIIIVFIIISRQHKMKLLKTEAENLRQELELKNKELVCNVKSIYVKNQVINKVARRLSKSAKEITSDNSTIINSIIKELQHNLDDTGWKEFELRFSQVHESFYNNLHAKFPALTDNEKKLAAMLKLGLSSKEVASITMTRSESVDTARSRLRKKLGINSDQNLTEFFNSI